MLLCWLHFLQAGRMPACGSIRANMQNVVMCACKAHLVRECTIHHWVSHQTHKHTHMHTHTHTYTHSCNHPRVSSPQRASHVRCYRACVGHQLGLVQHDPPKPTPAWGSHACVRACVCGVRVYEYRCVRCVQLRVYVCVCVRGMHACMYVCMCVLYTCECVVCVCVCTFVSCLCSCSCMCWHWCFLPHHNQIVYAHLCRWQSHKHAHTHAGTHTHMHTYPTLTASELFGTQATHLSRGQSLPANSLLSCSYDISTRSWVLIGTCSVCTFLCAYSVCAHVFVYARIRLCTCA